VEYLRGPFSALYGNSSGGVVQIFTQDGPKDPTLSGGITFGSYNTRRESLTFGDSGDGFDYIVNAASFRSDGYRDQSDTRRDTLHGKLNFRLGEDTKLTIVATALDQPDNEDPQGLDANQLKVNRKQAGTGAELFNTRVSRSHQQAGATLEHQFTPDDTLRLMAYYGQRKNEQYLSVAVGAQRNYLNGGGVAAIDRDFGGTITSIKPNAEFTPRVALTERERADLVFGVKVEFADTTGMLKAGLPITVHFEAPVPAKVR